MNQTHGTKPVFFKRILRQLCLVLLAVSLTGCIYWLRAYETYLQMSEFDRYFSVSSKDDFTLHFKEPIMYSKDFVSLAHLYASSDMPTKDGRVWRYWFRKIDAKNKVIKPEIKFYSELNFNKESKITDWTFSSLFLQIAPPKFLEVSLRSIGGAEIDKDKQQLKANTALLKKIEADLPKKATVLAQLGEPLTIVHEPEQDIYIYNFLLETPRVEEGFEDRVINEVKLSFDKKTDELIRMSGRFAGLKISVKYRKFLETAKGEES